ncbi:hypothetical protein [Mobiluncus mulieris]|nr:hypothetical protein [Mobiluncus mulieris]
MGFRAASRGAIPDIRLSPGLRPGLGFRGRPRLGGAGVEPPPKEA